ncbi:S41 family peptidase [Sphingobacterium corticis]|uniref:S41 family peptidase n=1 Tax=Sphingobacterium corticis TaxID=1812823 RepID=A0ABW5NNB1_9SPHI
MYKKKVNICSCKASSNLFLLVLTIIGLLSACKKEIEPVAPEPPVERNADQKLLDDIYKYYKEQSYWTGNVQAADPISRFTDQHYQSSASLITNANTILSALKSQTPFHAAYNGPLDRFSFIAESSGSSTVSRADKEDGYGITEAVVSIDNSTTGYIYIAFVEGGSPAANAGLRRGDRIDAINGNRNLTIPLPSSGPISDQPAAKLVSDALESNSFTIEVNREGTVIERSMQFANYEIDPLILDTVYTIQGRRVGYFALSSFEQLRGNGGTLGSRLDAMFARFALAQVQDVIVDFRYNVGGYVSSAEYLANKLINGDGNGKLMYKSDTNPNLRQGRYTGEFDDVFYEKNSEINPEKIYFLIGRNTASASELVISALMAHYNPNGNADANRRLHIIGNPSAVKNGTSTPSTYGKPMGFFPQDIGGKLELWAASFKIVNARNYTDYWDGIPATFTTPIQDNVLYNFGDTRESMIAAALRLNNTPANVSTQARAARSSNNENIQIIKDLNTRQPRELMKRK